jgi:hypothetical protein
MRLSQISWIAVAGLLYLLLAPHAQDMPGGVNAHVPRLREPHDQLSLRFKTRHLN